MDTFLRFHFTIAASEKWSNFASMFFGRIKFHDENLFKSGDYDCDHTKISFSVTVWKFYDFSISQILREIKFGDSRSAKSAYSTHSNALNFDLYESFWSIVHCGNFWFFYQSDFTWNQIWGFLKCKIRHFNTFRGFESWILWLFALKLKFRASKIANIAVY